ncbi:MAG: DUF2127 domain-containing protein [Candidatus Pacebacteria bacterium]|nr:DUF2127 domain-containing protein [Candidatus Paceibacterota bacterium]MCF7857192.1 DUF2127 domain-containing protein [Candidatus Paceibacterota bacterium]
MEQFDSNDVTSPKSVSFLFHLSMWWRIFYGFIRIVLGFILLNHIGSSFTDILTSVMAHEIVQDPADVLFLFIYQLIENHSFTVTYFVSCYLLFWGSIDIFLSSLLLKHKLWAFPVSMVLIALFIVYGIFRLTHTHSLVLLSVIIADIIILYLIHKEHYNLKKSIT